MRMTYTGGSHSPNPQPILNQESFQIGILSLLRFWRPMQFSAQCHFFLDQFRLSVRLSVRDKSTAKMARGGYYMESL